MITLTNERTHFFIKIYLSHFILERVMFVVCERWVGDRGRTAILTPSSSSTIAAFLSHLGLGCSTMGHWGPQSPQSASWFSRWHPDSNWLKPSEHLVILFYNVHTLPLFFHLFTQVHLLIDGSVEGQYITWVHQLGRAWRHSVLLKQDEKRPVFFITDYEGLEERPYWKAFE